MTTQSNTYILFGTVFLILTWLFVGIYRDNEFYEPNLFTKLQPTFKINFYSPIGQSDLAINDLNADEQFEEGAFREFVINQHNKDKSNDGLWYLPLILIQLTLTFFSFAILKSKQDLNFKKWHLPKHFIFCVLSTYIGIGLILHFDNWYSTFLGGIIILTVNYIVLIFMTNKYRKKSYT